MPSASSAPPPPRDPRSLPAGSEIPREEYCDQPFIAQTSDGAWLCVMTTAHGDEGAHSQHIVATRSLDQGKTWSPLIDIEPPGPPESSYATVLKAPSGRLFVFYNHNTDNLRAVKRDDGSLESRVDTLGHFVWKYSDDGGKTWSAHRYEIPIRTTGVDRRNSYGGAVKFFWHVGRPLILEGAAYVTLHKVGAFENRGFMTKSEGWFLRSENLLTEFDPAKVTWETLPDGDAGLVAPEGPIAEEQSIVPLSDGHSLYCTYRTVAGHPAAAYSYDRGHTWTPPAYMAYADGRLVKHPRAANFVWKCSNGRYLYWFHNHGGKWYDDRNPAWVVGGIEAKGRDGRITIRWSEPEILLYDDDPKVRMSYPDLVEQDGKYWVSETQKTIARVHSIDPALLQGLWGQFDAGTVAHRGLVVGVSGSGLYPKVVLPDLRKVGSGFSVEAWIKFDNLDAEQIIADTRGKDGIGWSLATMDHGTVRLTLSDGRTTNSWDCDSGALKPGLWQHIVATVDGGPKIITFVVNGVLSDGGTERQFGWGRFSPYLGDVSGHEPLTLGKGLRGKLGAVHVYSRPLRTSEAVGNFHAALPAR